MKTSKLIIPILLLTLIVKVDLLIAQSDLSEGWEIKVMNELQPPKKIMKAIGVKPGMVIGEIGAGRGL